MEEKAEETFTNDSTLEVNEILIKFSDVCRICLQQSSELVSIYDKTINDTELTILDKISLVVKIQKDIAGSSRLICTSCLNDLEAAYRFLQNFQSSEEILRSSLVYVKDSREVVDEQELPVDDFYHYKTEMYDEGEIIVHSGEVGQIETANLEDVLHEESSKEDYLEEEEEDIKPRKAIKKEKSTKLKRNNQRLESQQLHICEICANQYKYRHALEVHMRRHRGEKPFRCEYCNRCFVIRFELKRHMRVHTKDKPYCCRYCDRKFSDFGSRIKHERSHTGERPYVCQTCGKTFAYSHVLSGHLLTHTGEKKHQCTTCGKRFTKSHHLKSHVNTHLKHLGRQNALQQQSTQPTTENTATTQIITKTEDQELLNVVYI